MAKVFVMNQVYTSYTCPCEIQHPKVVSNKDTITIDVNRKCQLCQNGRILELVMGSVSSKIPKCTKCKCDESTMSVKLSRRQFAYFLRKGKE
jgi:hypothetical protein